MLKGLALRPHPRPLSTVVERGARSQPTSLEARTVSPTSLLPLSTTVERGLGGEAPQGADADTSSRLSGSPRSVAKAYPTPWRSVAATL